jgi:heme exporter protein C
VAAWLRRVEWAATLVVVAAVFWAIRGAFLVAPKERVMGNVQRIFYFHVPFAAGSFLGFFVVLVGSLAYLATRDRKWDLLAESAAELGVLYCTVVLVTGPIWARPIWGTWWTWEVRLTLTLLLWLIYVAYMLLRMYVEDPDQRARFSAVLGTLGFLLVPFVYFSVYLWKGLHPQGVLKKGNLDPVMRQVFLFNLATMVLLFFVLLGLRLRLALARESLAQVRQLERDR